jgi:signal recognition particle subunit SRP54
MGELREVHRAVKPHDVLLVVDAMTGQEAVDVAIEFDAAVGLTGVVLTKMDGDARGGAALSVKEVVGKPILFAGTGEKLEDFEAFHPDRMASRILGMGDVLTLIEKAEAAFDEVELEATNAKLRKGQITLEDFLDQMRQVRRMGPLQSVLKMLPGMPKELRNAEIDEGEPPGRGDHLLDDVAGADPTLINGSAGCGSPGSGPAPEVNAMLKQFKAVQQICADDLRRRLAFPGGLEVSNPVCRRSTFPAAWELPEPRGTTGVRKDPPHAHGQKKPANVVVADGRRAMAATSRSSASTGLAKSRRTSP